MRGTKKGSLRAALFVMIDRRPEADGACHAGVGDRFARVFTFMRTRTRVVIALAGMMLAMATLAMAVGAQRRSPLPSELDDSGFWRLVTDLSEPDGYFEDENYVSNELGYQRSMQRLQEAITPGGVVSRRRPGTELCLHRGASSATMAFIVDVRRQNMIEHLMYKALFELSDDRADFLSRLSPARALPALMPARVSKHCFRRTERRARIDDSSRTLWPEFSTCWSTGIVSDSRPRTAHRCARCSTRSTRTDRISDTCSVARRNSIRPTRK